MVDISEQMLLQQETAELASREQAAKERAMVVAEVEKHNSLARTSRILHRKQLNVQGMLNLVKWSWGFMKART